MTAINKRISYHSRSRGWMAFLVAILAMALQISPTQASDWLSSRLPAESRVVGQASLQVLFWDVFDATLRAPFGQYNPDKPFALTLSYQRRIGRDRLVNSSIDEMTGHPDSSPGALQRWEEALLDIFPDVKTGDDLTGIRTAEGHTEFFLDDEPLGIVRDPAFTHAFFDIWLGEETSRPDFRDALLGRSL